MQLQRKLKPLGTKPEPNATCRSHLGKARKNIANGGNDSLIGMEADLTISLAPDEADRQTAAQFAARRLVADSTVEASPQHVQFGLAHCAFEPQQEAIIEHGRMINAVGIADQRVGKSGQINQAIPFGVIARESRDFETEHQTDARERDVGGEAGKTRTRHRARTGETKILVDNDDAVIGPAEVAGFADKRILPLCRFAVVLDLCGAGLAQVDDRRSREMTWRNLDALIHRLPPSMGCSEAGVR